MQLPPPPPDPDDPEELESAIVPRDLEPPEHPDFWKHWDLSEDWSMTGVDDIESEDPDWEYLLRR